MLREIARAFAELRDPRVRGVLWLCIGLSLATLVVLAFAVEALLDWVATTGYVWLDRIVDLLGLLGTLVVAWLLFPTVVVAISSLFLERVVGVTEGRYYPDLPSPEDVPFARAVLAALGLLGASLLLNLLVLPLYLLPLLNVPLWLTLNGYLVGREYFELVALRRLDPEAARRTRRRHWLQFWAAGVAIAFLLAVPFVNLVAPIVGASFMTQRFHRVYRRTPAARADVIREGRM